MRTCIILLLTQAALAATAAEPQAGASEDFADIVIPVGWNALLNRENETGLIIGEYQHPGSAHTKLSLLNRPTLSSLAKAIEDLGYRPVLPRNNQPEVVSPRNFSDKPLPRPTLSKDFVDMVVPLGWNALLNPANKTAGIMGEFKTPGRAHTKLFLLTCESQAELMSVISRLGYKPLYPPTVKPGTKSAEK